MAGNGPRGQFPMWDSEPTKCGRSGFPEKTGGRCGGNEPARDPPRLHSAREFAARFSAHCPSGQFCRQVSSSDIALKANGNSTERRSGGRTTSQRCPSIDLPKRNELSAALLFSRSVIFGPVGKNEPTCRACGAPNYFSSTMWLRSVPMPEISTSSTSPAFIQTGGLRLPPMPSGVPVAMTSPGESCGEFRAEGDDCRDVVDQHVGARLLHLLAIQPCLQHQLGGIGNFVGRHQPGTERAGAREILCSRPASIW